MKYLNLLVLLGLSVFMYSCNDDDDPVNPQDANPIYFETEGSFSLNVDGDIEGIPLESVTFDHIQLNFDHNKNEIRIVTKLTPNVSGENATIEVPFVHDVTFSSVESTRSNDYTYSISMAQGSAYNESFSLASVCTPDPGFGAGKTDSSVAISNLIVWDSSKNKYYISTTALLTFLFGIVDPGFTLPPGTDPGFGNVPNFIYQSTGSIKGCSELPTLLN